MVGGLVSFEASCYTVRVSEPSAAPEREFSWKRLFWGIAPLGILFVFVGFDLPICPFRVGLGVPCPGCGLTRATLAIASGDLHGMLVFHPLAPLVTPLVVFTVVRGILAYAGVIPRRWDPLDKVPSWAWTGFAVLLLGLWGVRAAGFLGGLPDPIDISSGLFYRGAMLVISPFLSL